MGEAANTPAEIPRYITYPRARGPFEPPSDRRFLVTARMEDQDERRIR